MADRSVAVVGASGFVGRELLKTLRLHGIRATAVVRALPEVSAETDFHTVLVDDPGADGTRFDVVVNLAYPNTGPSYSYPKQNNEIFRTVEKLLKNRGHLIHVSTQAVFGSALDRPVKVGPVRAYRDDPYVEVKIAAERHFEKRQAARGWSVDIIRLGNVWGRASASWAVPLIHRLLTGRPVGIVGVEGFSNTTDVVNVASYLAFLVSRHDDRSEVRYHHLAEFSAVRWRDWILPTAEAMLVKPTYADLAVLRTPTQSLSEVLGLRGMYRILADGRVSGSWTRSAVRLLPDRLRTRLKGKTVVFAREAMPSRSELTYLAIMSAQQEFKSSVEPGWAPPVTQEESLERLLLWLREPRP